MFFLNYPLISYKNRFIELPSAYETKTNLKSVTVSFSDKSFINEDQTLFRSSFFLETLYFQRPKFLLTKKPIRFGRLMKKKNEPIGMLITLRKLKFFSFFNRFIWEILPIAHEIKILKNYNGQIFHSIQFFISDLFHFKELQKYFFFVSGLTKLIFNINFKIYPTLNNYKKKKLFLFELKLMQIL